MPGQTSSQNSIIIISGDYMSIGGDVMIQEIKCSNLILRRTAQFCEKNTEYLLLIEMHLCIH